MRKSCCAAASGGGTARFSLCITAVTSLKASTASEEALAAVAVRVQCHEWRYIGRRLHEILLQETMQSSFTVIQKPSLWSMFSAYLHVTVDFVMQRSAKKKALLHGCKQQRMLLGHCLADCKGFDAVSHPTKISLAFRRYILRTVGEKESLSGDGITCSRYFARAVDLRWASPHEIRSPVCPL